MVLNIEEWHARILNTIQADLFSSAFLNNTSLSTQLQNIEISTCLFLEIHLGLAKKNRGFAFGPELILPLNHHSVPTAAYGQHFPFLLYS